MKTILGLSVIHSLPGTPCNVILCLICRWFYSDPLLSFFFAFRHFYRSISAKLNAKIDGLVTTAFARHAGNTSLVKLIICITFPDTLTANVAPGSKIMVLVEIEVAEKFKKLML